VAPLGVDLARLANAPDEAVAANLRRRLGTGRFILYVGTIEPRKNIIGLVRAFERIAGKYPDLKLVIAGKRGWGYDTLNECIAASPLRDRIVLPGYIDDAEKHALFKSATLFTYLSFYEGFGLPVLEGMAAGVATITSNTSSLPEVAGDGALQVDPNDVGEIAAAITMLLDNARSRAQLVQHGVQQARIFTWKSMAARSLDFYQQLLAEC
jgi:glycosyltransferase involved in cell wall biosynthesis